jgi:hypothetical protein
VVAASDCVLGCGIAGVRATLQEVEAGIGIRWDLDASEENKAEQALRIGVARFRLSEDRLQREALARRHWRETMGITGFVKFMQRARGGNECRGGEGGGVGLERFLEEKKGRLVWGRKSGDGNGRGAGTGRG